MPSAYWEMFIRCENVTVTSSLSTWNLKLKDEQERPSMNGMALSLPKGGRQKEEELWDPRPSFSSS